MPDQQHEGGSMRATAHLPGLEIEILHRRSAADDAEFISINLQAVPSFEAFGRYLEIVNPFVLWAQVARMAWLPWIEALKVMDRALKAWAPTVCGYFQHIACQWHN
jgi:hypothetical protein